MNIVVSLVIGGSIGWAASTIMGTPDRQGLLLNIAIGMTGAVLCFWLLSSLVDVAITRATFALSASLLSCLALSSCWSAKLTRVA